MFIFNSKNLCEISYILVIGLEVPSSEVLRFEVSLKG
jgi:hypothetical protein